MRFQGPKEPQGSPGGSLGDLGSWAGLNWGQKGGKRGAIGRSRFDVFLILAREFPFKLKYAFLVIRDILFISFVFCVKRDIWDSTKIKYISGPEFGALGPSLGGFGGSLFHAFRRQKRYAH